MAEAYANRHHDCNGKVCNCIKDSETACTYCSKWTKKTVFFDEEARECAIEKVEQALGDVSSSRIFF